MLTTLLWQVDRDMEFDDFENWFENLKLERANGVEKLNARIRLSQYFDEVLEGNLHVIVEVPATGEFEQPLAVTAYLIASPCPRFITLTISPTLLLAVTRSHLLSHLPHRFDLRYPSRSTLLSATALVPHRELCLFCWVQGDNPQQTFKLSIPANEHVSDLRKAIRKEKQNAFRGVDADTLMLWKVNAFHCLCEQLLTTRPRTG
jgi:hypothetical protein